MARADFRRRAHPVAALSGGFSGLWRCRSLVFPLYLANLAVSLVAVLPFYVALHRLTANRPTAAQLAHSLDLEILAELAFDHPALLAMLRGLIVFVPLLYLLLSQFLLAGALGALVARDGRPGLRRFGADALGGGLRLCWVGLGALLPFAVAALVTYLGLRLGRIVRGDGSWLWLLPFAAPGVLVFALVNAALEFARAVAVLDSERPFWSSLLVGLRAAFTHPFATVLLQLATGLGLWLPVGLLLLLPSTLDAGSSAAILGAFVLRQLIIAARVGARVAALGAHLVFIEEIRAAPVAAHDKTVKRP